MKKRKKINNTLNIKTAKKNFPSFYTFIATNKKYIFLFFLTFLILTIITLQKKPINTHQPYGDNYYYYKNAVQFSKVWSKPFYYFKALLFHELSYNQLAEIGLRHDSDFDSLLRAPSYIIYLSLWVFIFGQSELSALLSQVFILSLIFLLTFIILEKFYNKKIALITYILMFFELGFYMLAVVTMTELFQAFTLLLLFYYSNKIFSYKLFTIKNGIILSIILLLFNFSKATNRYFYLFFILLLILFYFAYYKSTKKERIHFIKIFLIPILLIILLFNIILSNGKNYNKYDASTIGAGKILWGGACIPAEGYIVDTGYHPFEFRKNINKGRDIFWFYKYSEISFYALIDLIKNHPLPYISMIIKRLGSIITHPPLNFQNKKYLLKIRKIIAVPFHFILIIIALLGFILLTSKKFLYLKLFFLIAFSYYSSIYAIANPSTRFFSPFIPFFFIFSAQFIHSFLLNNRRNIMMIVILLILTYIFTNKYFLVLFIKSIILIKLFATLIIIFSLYLIIKLLLKINPDIKLYNKNKISFLINWIFIIFYLLTASLLILDAKQYNHFIIKNKKSITEKIIINKKKLLCDNEKIFIIMDIREISTNAYFTLNFNNFITNIIIKKHPEINIFSTNYNKNYKNILNINKWIFIPIESTYIKNTNIITISNINDIHFFYQLKNNKNYNIIPAIYYKTSFTEVYGAFTLYDNRIFFRKKISSSRKSFLNNKYLKNKDFNIYLMGKTRYSYYIYKRYEKLNEANLKFIAIINPVDRGIIKFINSTNKILRTNLFTPVKYNLYRYLAGEMDRFIWDYNFY